MLFLTNCCQVITWSLKYFSLSYDINVSKKLGDINTLQYHAGDPNIDDVLSDKDIMKVDDKIKQLREKEVENLLFSKYITRIDNKKNGVGTMFEYMSFT